MRFRVHGRILAVTMVPAARHPTPRTLDEETHAPSATRHRRHDGARWDGGVCIAVTDQGGPYEPVSGDADLDAASGRGLRAVSLTADGWGWFGNEHSCTVTALFTPDATATFATRAV